MNKLFVLTLLLLGYVFCLPFVEVAMDTFYFNPRCAIFCSRWRFRLRAILPNVLLIGVVLLLCSLFAKEVLGIAAIGIVGIAASVKAVQLFPYHFYASAKGRTGRLYLLSEFVYILFIAIICHVEKSLLLFRFGFLELFSILALAAAIYAMRAALQRNDLKTGYEIDRIRLQGDFICQMRLLRRAEKAILPGYDASIKKYAKQYCINEQVLRQLVLLEASNTKGVYEAITENLLCTFFPSFVKNGHLTIGITQLSYLTICQFASAAKRDVGSFRRILKDGDLQIEVCAWYLSCLFDKHRNNADFESLLRAVLCDYTGAIINNNRNFIKIYVEIILKEVGKNVDRRIDPDA